MALPHDLPAPDLEASLEALHEASYGWARSCCDGDPHEAADVLQSAYVKVLSGAARFHGRSSFRTWLFGVIRFTAMEERRRGAREFSLDQHPDPETPAPSVVATLIEAEEHAALHAAITLLPGRQREVLHLVFQQELTIAEASTVMGVSLGSARVHYERAKQRLRDLLSDSDRARAARAGRESESGAADRTTEPRAEGDRP